MSGTITTEAVRSAMREVGHGHYASYANDLQRHIVTNGLSAGTVLNFASARRGSVSRDAAERFVAILSGSTSGGDSTQVTDESVRTAMQDAGYGGYTSHAANIRAALMRNGFTVQTVQDYARSRGITIPAQTAQRFLDSLQGQSTEPITGEDTEAVEGFDRDAAAARLREFADSKGADMDEVEDVLIEVGLVDEPEPEPEDAEDDESLLSRLVSWARGRGFSG